MVDIKELKKYEPLYIIGHKKPDVDTVISTYLLTNILSFFDIEAYSCILSEGYTFDKYNKSIINDFLEFRPNVISKEEVSKYNFVLVDHNDPIQSIGTSNNIVFGMDHHKDSNKTKNILFSNLCANSLFIYSYFKDDYQFSSKEKELVMLATLTDTLYFKTNRYKEEDKVLIKELGISLNSEELFNKYFESTNLSIGLDNIIKNSDRDFSYGNITFSSSVIYTKSNKIKEKEEYREAIFNGNTNHLGMWNDLENNKTYAFFKANNFVKEFEYDFIASRASTVIKDVFSYLDSIS